MSQARRLLDELRQCLQIRTRDPTSPVHTIHPQSQPLLCRHLPPKEKHQWATLLLVHCFAFAPCPASLVAAAVIKCFAVMAEV